MKMPRKKRCHWVRVSHPQAQVHIWRCAVCLREAQVTYRGKPEQVRACGQAVAS